MEQIEKTTEWDSGGGVTLDLVHLVGGAVIAISAEAIALYSSPDDLEAGEPKAILAR